MQYDKSPKSLPERKSPRVTGMADNVGRNVWLANKRALGGIDVIAFITGSSSLEPLLEGLFAQIHVNLS